MLERQEYTLKEGQGIYIMWAAGTLAMGNQTRALEDRIGSARLPKLWLGCHTQFVPTVN